MVTLLVATALSVLTVWTESAGTAGPAARAMSERHSEFAAADGDGCPCDDCCGGGCEWALLHVSCRDGVLMEWYASTGCDDPDTDGSLYLREGEC